MSYIIKVKNTAGTEGTVVADAGFSYTDKLSDINEGQLKITGTSVSKRGLFEIGSEVFIYRNGTLEFHGLINGITYLNAGGIAADLIGYEVWLGKENGNYAGSPWSSTASATIASAVIGESNYFTAGTVQAGETMDFRAVATSSLWNVLSSIVKRTAQDIGIDYSDSTVDILDHKGNSTSVATFNDGIQIQDLTVRQSYPIANDVRVYGQSEGQTRIKSDHTTSGQDATSKSTYGTIRKIYEDSTVTTQAEANLLANKLVAKWKDPIKVYEFDIINFNQNIVSGDVIILNSQTKNLSNEEVRIVGIEKGVRNNQEFLTLQVTNKEYSQTEKGVNQYIAELEKKANDMANYDQYVDEYSNQNIGTCVGGGSYFDTAFAYLAGNIALFGNGICGCSGDWLYLNGNLSVPSGVVQMGTLNVNTSSAFNTIDGELIVTQNILANTVPTLGCHLTNKTYVDSVAGGDSLWADAVNPYITPCNSCGLLMCENIKDATSLHSLGTAESPGAFKDVNAACGMFTTCACSPIICGSTCIRGATFCATSGINSSGDVIASSSVGTFARVNINGSSACNFYVSGNGTYSGTLAITYANTTCTNATILCGTCTFAACRLKIPVGTNCY